MIHAAEHEPRRLAASGQTGAAVRFSLFGGFRFCRLITVEPGLPRRSSRLRFALDGERLLVRTPATSDLASRVWRSARVAVAPCTRRNEVVGPAIEAGARVLRADEEPAAEAALAAGDRLFERIGLSLLRRRGVDLLYVEIVAA